MNVNMGKVGKYLLVAGSLLGTAGLGYWQGSRKRKAREEKASNRNHSRKRKRPKTSNKKKAA